MLLENKVAIVTGASRGIGAVIATSLAAEGASIAVNYRDAAEQAGALRVVAQICQSGGTAFPVCADIRDVQAMRAMFQQVRDTCQGVDIVIGNAGDAVARLIDDTSEQDYDHALALNARGQFFLLQESARQVRERGAIVLLSSTTASHPYPKTAVYSGAKMASEMYARVLAREIAARQVTVNIVSPGQTATETMLAQTTQERRDYVASQTPLGRLGQPVDIADVVVYLCSDAARSITGQNLHVSGGFL